jgi:hypothetical protein
MSDTEKEVQRTVTLESSFNYASWRLSIANHLLGKDLLKYVSAPVDLQSKADAKEVKNAGKAFLALLKSLSNIVTASLPSDLKDPFSPTPVALWKHLEATYSAQNGARTAALLQEVWGKVIPEGENPASHIGRINSCYAEILQGKIDHDTMLAFAMIQALPKSFATIKQALWLRTPLKSADVAAAVQAEWSRRSSGEENVALKARLQQAGKGFQPKPRDGSKYCDLHKTTGHSNDQCYLQGAPRPANNNNNNNNNKPRFPAPKANVATAPPVATAENHISSLSIDDSDSDSVKSYIAHANSVANNNNSTYIVDSGAIHHMVVNSTLLHDVKPIATQWIVVGNGEKVPASSMGTLKLGKAVFTNVLVAPGLDRNLISVGASTNKWEFDKQSATLVDSNNIAILTAQRSSGLYVIKASEIAIAMSASADNPSYSALCDWHERLGHVNVRRVMMMGRDGRIDGLSQVSAKEVNEFECAFCIRGKGKRLPSPRSDVCSSTPLALVHIDLWGPATTTSTGGSRYFLTCYDDFTHRIDLSFLKLKSEAFVAMTNYIAKVERQLACKVKMIRSDNGGEFTSKQWENYMVANGMVHVKVAPDAHAQNGRVERVHLTILDDVRTLLLQSGLSPSYGRKQRHIRVIFATIHLQITRKHPSTCGIIREQLLNICNRLVARFITENTTKSVHCNLDTKKGVYLVMFQILILAEYWILKQRELLQVGTLYMLRIRVLQQNYKNCNCNKLQHLQRLKLQKCVLQRLMWMMRGNKRFCNKIYNNRFCNNKMYNNRYCNNLCIININLNHGRIDYVLARLLNL